MIEMNDGRRHKNYEMSEGRQVRKFSSHLIFWAGDFMTFGRYDIRLGAFQRIGQLEHIITEHVDIGLCIREASRESSKHYHTRFGFFGQ